MSAEKNPTPPQSTDRASDVRAVSSVRSQAAFVRALLDEVERVAPSGSGSVVSEQLVEELARLGCRCIETASALTAVVDAQEQALESLEGVPRCA
jgi:hypothetical protein